MTIVYLLHNKLSFITIHIFFQFPISVVCTTPKLEERNNKFRYTVYIYWHTLWSFETVGLLLGQVKDNVDVEMLMCHSNRVANICRESHGSILIIRQDYLHTHCRIRV